MGGVETYLTATVEKTGRVRRLLGRFRKKNPIIQDEIKIGDSLPEIDVEMVSVIDSNATSGSMAITASEFFGGQKGKTHVLVGMPGAYTLTCTNEHLPGFRDNVEHFKRLGVDKIGVLTTNDRFVNSAWAQDLGVIEEETKDVGGGGIVMLSDADTELVRGIGLAEDMGFGLVVRSKRFAMVIKDGVVTHLQKDEGMEECSNTSAGKLVELLTPAPKKSNKKSMFQFPDGVDADKGSMGFLFATLLAGALIVANN